MGEKIGIRFIISYYIIEELKKFGYHEKQLCNFIAQYWNGNGFSETKKFVKLFSPTKNTTAYKGYFSDLDRTIVFYQRIDKKGVVYPIFFGDKKTKLGKNISKNISEDDIYKLNEKFNEQLKKGEYKIIHL